MTMMMLKICKPAFERYAHAVHVRKGVGMWYQWYAVQIAVTRGLGEESNAVDFWRLGLAARMRVPYLRHPIS